MDRWNLPKHLQDAVNELDDAQQKVFDRLYRWESGVIQLRFPEGRIIEARHLWTYTQVREIGGEWEDTLVRSAYDLINWLEVAQVELVDDRQNRSA